MNEPARRQRLCQLLEPLHEELRAAAHRLCRGRADGDDLFQEAAMRALIKIDGLREDGAFRVWFYRVLVSVHRSRGRRGFWNRLVPFGDQHGSWVEPADPGSSERMRAALAVLPSVQREAIVLYELQGLSVGEVADVQGTTASAVKSRLSRGRGRLRAVYRKRFDIGGERAAALLRES